MVAAGAVLYGITRGLLLDTVSPWQALAVHCFSIASGLIEPSPTDLGAIEASGVASLLALGLRLDRADSVMLINRALSAAAGLVIGGAGILMLAWPAARWHRGHIRAPALMP